mmetsp:Transcript_41905/g.73556  ORF Transcript_41905/g.73556 Transcript_41905/m.73556 type:complete len:229 (-) Transcript_41905:645-1331(-)
MTMGTLLFGLLGLTSLPGEAGCITSSSTICGGALAVTQLAKFVTAFVFFLGLEYGSGGFGSSVSSIRQRLKNLLGELGGGCKRVWRTLPFTDERTFYRTFLIFVTLGNLIFNIPELVFHLRYGREWGCSRCRLVWPFLLPWLGWVLPDLSRILPIKTQCLIFTAGIAQEMDDGPTMPFNIRRAADELLLGLLFLNNGILSSQLSKRGIVKKRDKEDPDAAPPLRIGLF